MLTTLGVREGFDLRLSLDVRMRCQRVPEGIDEDIVVHGLAETGPSTSLSMPGMSWPVQYTTRMPRLPMRAMRESAIPLIPPGIHYASK